MEKIDTEGLQEIIDEVMGINEAKSKANTEVLKAFLTYVKKNKIKINKTFLGSYIYNMEKSLAKTNKELFDPSKGVMVTFKADYEEKYGKNWEGVTFKKAIKQVYGPNFFKEWNFLNSKASVKKRYPNPKHFKYVGDYFDIEVV